MTIILHLRAAVRFMLYRHFDLASDSASTTFRQHLTQKNPEQLRNVTKNRATDTQIDELRRNALQRQVINYRGDYYTERSWSNKKSHSLIN